MLDMTVEATGCASSRQVGSTDGDTLHEECGVFGVWAPGRDVARITYFGLRRSSTAGRSRRASPWVMAAPLWSARTSA